MIAGLLGPTQGKIFFGDDDVTQLTPENREVGLVFQNYALYPHMTIRKNILFPLENMEIKKNAIKDAYREAYLLLDEENAKTYYTYEASLQNLKNLFRRKEAEATSTYKTAVATKKADFKEEVKNLKQSGDSEAVAAFKVEHKNVLATLKADFA